MAVPLFPGKQQFLDRLGVALALGSVGHYVPGTMTPKQTWQDSSQSVLNSNPITLDAAGYAQIYGSGLYRQIVKDVLGNVIWDQVSDAADFSVDIAALQASLAAPSGAGLVGQKLAGTTTVASTVQEKLDVSVSIDADFGAAGDGSNDDTALSAFQTWALAQPSGTAITLEMGRGKTYGFLNPRWVAKVPLLRVHGNGATMKNLGVSGANSLVGLVTADVTSYNFSPSVNPNVNFFNIATTAIGDTSVSCLTAANAGNFAVGDYLLIASFDQQFTGFPFNARYFEYAKVLTANAGTGVITLDRQLKYAHNQNFPFKSGYASGDGRASIYQIAQNGNVFDIDHVYEDLNFSFTNVQTFNNITISGRKVVCRNVTCNYILMTQGEYLEADKCKVTGAFEIDKLVTTGVWNGCVFKERVTSGTGVENLIFRDTQFRKGWKLNAKSLTFENCADASTAALKSEIQTGVGYCADLKIIGGTMTYLPTYTNGVTQEDGSLTLNGTGVSWDGTAQAITINLTTAAFTAVAFASLCFVGQVMRVRQTAGSFLRTSNYGIVTSVVGDGAGVSSVITVAWNDPAAIAGTERVIIDAEPFSTKIDCNITSAGRPVPRDYVIFPKRNFEVSNATLASSTSTTYTMLGVMSLLRVTVLRPYTGATGGNILLTVTSAGTPPFTLTIDLKTAGTREATAAYNYGFTGAAGESVGANLTVGYPADFFANLVLNTSVMAGTAKQMPIVDVQLEVFDPAMRLNT